MILKEGKKNTQSLPTPPTHTHTWISSEYYCFDMIHYLLVVSVCSRQVFYSPNASYDSAPSVLVCTICLSIERQRQWTDPAFIWNMTLFVCVCVSPLVPSPMLKWGGRLFQTRLVIREIWCVWIFIKCRLLHVFLKNINLHLMYNMNYTVMLMYFK